MKYIKLLGLTVLMVLLAGCAATGNVVKEADNQADVALKQLQILTHSSSDVDVAGVDEVSLYITNGGFSPSVIEARAGQTVVVTSYVQDKIHFSLEAFGVEEPIDEAETFRFTAGEPGEYSFVCLDCQPGLKGTLLVE